jgi:predicted O-linked N-acetylglucosamine transferase (SPINDLY family)
MSSIAQAIGQAWQYHQAGQLHEAQRRYRQILQTAPEQPDAWYLLGVACQMLGQLPDAVTAYQQALRLRPDYVEVHNNLGVAYKMQGQVSQAIACYREALRLKPGYADAYNNLGLALADQGQLADAIACYQQALALAPNHADAHNNLGNVFKAQGRFQEAMVEYRAVIWNKPEDAAAHDNLGQVLQARGQLEEAVAEYRTAIWLKRDDPFLHTRLGIALQTVGQVDEAIAACREAVRLQSQDPGLHINLGLAFHSKGMLDDAIAEYRETIRLDKDVPEAYYNLGVALLHQGRLDLAVPALREAIQRRPDSPGAYSSLLACYNYDPANDPDTVYQEHRRWDERYGHGGPVYAHPNSRDPERRLRIGYVSPDFRQHAVAHFLQAILAHHDPRQVEVFCYAEVAVTDAITERIQARGHVWRSTIGLSDPEVAHQIRGDGIDILVELDGHFANNRLMVFVQKPAPVQINYVGYPSTTGLSAIDYRLTDAVADPPGEPIRHSEELVRLPLAFCYTPRQEAPAVSPLPALTTGHIAFGSLHNLAKLNSQVLDLWGRLLHALPSARLIVFRDLLHGSVRDYLHEQLTRRGISPERFDLMHRLEPGRHYLEIYSSIDVTLDAFPWNGHTTACESLWMGVPVVTLRGNRYAGRMAADVLRAVGLPELVAQTPEQYIAIASKLAGNLDRLSQLRSGLRGQMRSSPLCDGPTFTRSLEEVYRSLWRRWCARSQR